LSSKEPNRMGLVAFTQLDLALKRLRQNNKL
jgi:hypothetical protein